MALVEYGRFQPEKLVSHVCHGMDKVEEVLQMMGGQDRTIVKPVVYFD